MSASFYDLLKYAATGIASPDMSYYDKMRASALMGGATVQTLTGQPPLTFKADGTPLISWSMKGNGSQQGTPTPENPVMPEFVGYKTANLFNKTSVMSGYIINDENGNRQAGGSSSNASDYIQISGDYVSVYAATTGSARWGAFYDSSKTYISGISGYNRAIAIPANAAYMRLTVVNELLDTLMVNIGSTALPYEPFGYKIPLTCAGQTVPVYLGQASTVRRVRKLVFDGTETGWIKNTISENNAYYRSISDYYRYNGICTHYAAVDSVRAVTGIFFGGNINFLTQLSDEIDTIDKWKSFLASEYAAGHPVTIWYVLATPETAIVNEPLAKIGDYADELHSTDAAVTIPTIKGQNTLTVDTPIQPSEMTITFKG